jgi:hypothetical protein
VSGIFANCLKPSAICSRIERDCREIECLLDALEHAQRSLRERPDHASSAVRRQCELLRDRLLRHSNLQRAILVPALRAADPWGEQRARTLIDWLTRRQADLDALFGVGDGDIPPIRRLVDYVRHDIRRERAHLLESDLLRDDVVGIDVQTG